MDLKQLLTVGDNTSPSSSQLWFHIINVAILIIYLFIGFKVGYLIVPGTTANISQIIDSMMWFTVGISGIITSNKFANVLANLKLGKKDDK